MTPATEDLVRIQALRKQLEDMKYHIDAATARKMADEHTAIVTKQNYFKVLPNDNDCLRKALCLDKERFLWTFNRIVCGAHGPYIEFSKPMLAMELETTPGQKWREGGKYSVKYYHLNPIHFRAVKIYYQVRTVNYADYIVGKYYVDLWEPRLTIA